MRAMRASATRDLSRSTGSLTGSRSLRDAKVNNNTPSTALHTKQELYQHGGKDRFQYHCTDT